MQTNSGQPCGICGDIGNPKAIATCSKCRKAREHIYCMHPHLFNVPRSWHCEACRSTNIVHRGNCRSSDLRRHLEENVEILFEKQKTRDTGNVSSTGPDASPYLMPVPPQPLPRKLVPKKVDTGKVRYIEVVCGRSGIKSKLSSSRGSSSSHPIPKLSSPKSSLEKDHSFESVRHTKPPTTSKVHTSILQKQAVGLSQQSTRFSCEPPRSKNIEDNAVLRTDTKLVTEAQDCSLNHIGPVVSGVQAKSDFENTLSRLDKHAGKLGTLLSKDQLYKEDRVDAAVHCQNVGTSTLKSPFRFGEEDLPNPPAVDALWRGSFEVSGLSREIHEGFQAFPPGKISSKVYLVSREMPRVLKFTLQPRRFVWPDTFCTYSPCGFDVALYFWADDCCRENYNYLLEMMDEKDFSMRSHLNGVELLIFSSKQLPVESQRMNMQYYLWGIFVSPEGWDPPVYLKEEEHNADFLLHSQKVGECPAGNACKPNGLRMNMDIDSVGVKEERGVDGCLRINSRDTSNNTPQDVFSAGCVKSIDAKLLHQMKRKQYDDFDAPPGFAGPMHSHNVGQGLAGSKHEPNNQKVNRDVDSVGGNEDGRVDKSPRTNFRGSSSNTTQGSACITDDPKNQEVNREVDSVGVKEDGSEDCPQRINFRDTSSNNSPKGRDLPVCLKDDFDFQVHSQKVGERPAGTACKPDHLRVNMDIDSVGVKEERGVDDCLRINSRDTSNNTSQAVFSGVRPCRPLVRSIDARHLHHMKRKRCDDFDAPPGFSGPVRSRKVGKGSAGTTHGPNNQKVNREVDSVGGKDDRRVENALRINSRDCSSNNSQGSAGTTGKPNNQRAKREVDSVGSKEDRELGNSLRINSRDTSTNNFSEDIDTVGVKEERGADGCRRINSRDNSQAVFYGAHSHLPLVRSTDARHPHQMKREHYDDFDAHPGFSRPMRSHKICQGSAGTTQEPKNQKVNREVNSVGGKEDRRVDTSLRINSRDISGNSSQGSAGTTHGPNNQKVNKEIDSVGGKEDRRVDHSLRINSRDYSDSCEERFCGTRSHHPRRIIGTGHRQRRQREQDDFDARSRFPGPVTINASVGWPIETSPQKVSFDAREADSPGFFKPTKSRDKVFSSKVTNHHLGRDFIDTPSREKKGCDQHQGPAYSRRVQFQYSDNYRAKFRPTEKNPVWCRSRRAKRTQS